MLVTGGDIFRRVRSLFDGSEIAYSAYRRHHGSLKRKLLHCNGQYLAYAGRSMDHLSSVDVRIHQERDHGNGHSLELQSLVESGVPYSGFFKWNLPGGETLEMVYTAFPMNVDGELLVMGLDLPAERYRNNTHPLFTAAAGEIRGHGA